MYKRKPKNWAKHYDFIFIDFIMIQISLAEAIFVCYGLNWMSIWETYRDAAMSLALINLLVMFFCDSYKGMLNRNYEQEVKAVVKHMSFCVLLFICCLFFSNPENIYPKEFFICLWVRSIILSYSIRSSRKMCLIKKKSQKKESLVVITTYEQAEKTIKLVSAKTYESFSLTGICLVDRDMTGEQIEGIPVIACEKGILEYIKSHWVDEVLINLETLDIVQKEFRDSLLQGCNLMGITVHQVLLDNRTVNTENTLVENIGEYMVLSNSINIISPAQLFIKRTMDIVGGLAGVVLTGILTVTIGPIIYYCSPGPVFFSQERIGKNGKKFKMYKFRSMYMDAEERKKELMEQNEIKDGMMFKMENDPRIIKGIGHFIRETSLDEFPQFYNVLKGDMSLIGTRPPTVDEWEKYDLHHRTRMSIKPGITGMWQVSGRSNITDFEEVVSLDTQYIQNWSLGLDMEILFKTIGVVMKKEGSR